MNGVGDSVGFLFSWCFWGLRLGKVAAYVFFRVLRGFGAAEDAGERFN